MTLNPKTFFPNDTQAQAMAAAAMRGDVGRLKQLVASGGNPKAKGERAMTLPHFALHAPDPEALVWLIQQGADPVSALPTGATVPHYAVAKKDAQGKPTAAWIEPLLKLGVSPDLIGDEGQYTLLVAATVFDNILAARALKNAGANMNLEPTPLSGSAIDWALSATRLDMAAELADLGVDPRIKHRMGNQMLNAAEVYCKRLSGTLTDPARKAQFDRMAKAFERWGLSIPCGF